MNTQKSKQDTLAPPDRCHNKPNSVLTIVLLKALGLVLLDPIFKWGEKTCPRCFSRKLIPFTIEKSDERPMHYCNGCNTIWP